MNELIKTIFNNFTVDGVSIPVKFLHYYGHGEPYVVFQKESMNYSFSADDNLQGHVEYYDFDIYTKENYNNIVDAVKSKLIENNFFFEPDRSSGDMYEQDTGYYHITLNFSYIRGD